MLQLVISYIARYMPGLLVDMHHVARIAFLPCEGQLTTGLIMATFNNDHSPPKNRLQPRARFAKLLAFCSLHAFNDALLYHRPAPPAQTCEGRPQNMPNNYCFVRLPHTARHTAQLSGAVQSCSLSKQIKFRL